MKSYQELKSKQYPMEHIAQKLLFLRLEMIVFLVVLLDS